MAIVYTKNDQGRYVYVCDSAPVHSANSGDTAIDVTNGIFYIYTTSWIALGSGGAGGSGTLNYIPKWTPDGTTLGDSIIQDDGTKVGIGSGIGIDSKVIVTSTALNDLMYGFEVNNLREASVVSSIGLGAVANGVATTSYNIGGHFIASNNTNGNFSLQLVDGSQDTGKFLKSITANGHANWSTLNERDVQIGTVSGYAFFGSTFDFLCGTYLIGEFSGGTSNVTITFNSPQEGQTYSMVFIQSASLIDLTLPTGYWLNDTAPFDFSTELASTERAMITATYLNSTWYFAVKKLQLV